MFDKAKHCFYYFKEWPIAKSIKFNYFESQIDNKKKRRLKDVTKKKLL